MVLSGTLREFILADVLQLLTQQKITGRLVINSSRTEGTILFKNGNIIGATRGTESFIFHLFFYLTTILDLPRNKVRELFSSYDGKIAELTAYLEKKSVMTHEELEEYATSVIIDIACSLFLWTSGSYHFDSIPDVDSLIPSGICLPVENIVMEAMRRIDEWHRMKEAITEETIYVKTQKVPALNDQASVLEEPAGYYYQQINGTSSVKVLLDNSFLSEYKIYECLYTLLQDENITPLSDKLTRTVKAALDRSDQEKNAPSPLFPILITVGIVFLLFLISWFFRNTLFRERNRASLLQKNELYISNAEHQLRNYHQFMQMQSLTDTADSKNDTASTLMSNKERKALALQKTLRNREKTAE